MKPIYDLEVSETTQTSRMSHWAQKVCLRKGRKAGACGGQSIA